MTNRDASARRLRAAAWNPREDEGEIRNEREHRRDRRLRHGRDRGEPSAGGGCPRSALEAQWEEEREAALQESREMDMGETEASPLQSAAAREAEHRAAGR